MNIHSQFKNTYFLLLLIVFIVIILVILIFKKQNWKVVLEWKVLASAVVITLLGILYSESSKSDDWLIETSGFPKYFYMKKSSLGKDAFMDWGIVQFDYRSFLQNFILIFLLLDIFKLIFKKKFQNTKPLKVNN